MVTVGTPRRGIAQPGGKARLAEQASRRVHEVVEIVEDEYLIIDGEEVGHAVGRNSVSTAAPDPAAWKSLPLTPAISAGYMVLSTPTADLNALAFSSRKMQRLVCMARTGVSPSQRGNPRP